MKRLTVLWIMLISFMMADLTAYAGEKYQDTNVYSDTDVLTEEELQEFNEKAKEVTETYGVGVYAAIVEDYYHWEFNLREAAEMIFEENNFGEGSDRDGIMLLLSMEDRDYILLVHGYAGNDIFYEDAREFLEDHFLEDFGEDHFAIGLSEYLNQCEYLISEGGDAELKDGWDHALEWFISIFLGATIGGFIAYFMKEGMKSVAFRAEAHEYVTKDGLTVSFADDRYTHTTTVRRSIKDSNDSSSGGYSSSSGKF